jgi:hypothetical protein
MDHQKNTDKREKLQVQNIIENMCIKRNENKPRRKNAEKYITKVNIVL